MTRTVSVVIVNQRIRIGRRKPHISPSEQTTLRDAHVQVTLVLTKGLVEVASFSGVQFQSDPLTDSLHVHSVPLTVTDLDMR